MPITRLLRPLAEGWALTGLIAALVAAAACAAYGLAGGGSDGLRAAIRLTARTSLVLFLASFAASALVRLCPAPATRWLLANRRFVGVGFALSHLMHAVAIAGLYRADPGLFWTLAPVATLMGGGSVYLVILAMAGTSFDQAVRWLGIVAWRRLHWWGAWFIWASFLATNLRRLPQGAWYWLAVALVLAACGLRLLVAAREAAAVRRPAG